MVTEANQAHVTTEGIQTRHWIRILIREHIVDVGQIVLSGTAAVIFRRWPSGVRSIVVLIGLSLYPWIKTMFYDLFHDRRVNPRLCVVAAISLLIWQQDETMAGLLLSIILTADLVAKVFLERAHRAIRSIFGFRTDLIVLRDRSSEKIVGANSIVVGDVVVVRSGDTVPVDGRIVSGEAVVRPPKVLSKIDSEKRCPGDYVSAGAIIEAGEFCVRVERVYPETLRQRSLSTLDGKHTLGFGNAKSASLSDLVLIVFALLVILALGGTSLLGHKTVAILIILGSIGLARSVSFVEASVIATSFGSGIFFQDEVAISRLAQADVAAFDKRGMLVDDIPVVVDIRTLRANYYPEELLMIAAAVMRGSDDPTAQAILAAAEDVGIQIPMASRLEETNGKGVIATLRGKRVIVGTSDYLVDLGIAVGREFSLQTDTVIHIVVNEELAGIVVLADEFRPGVRESLEALRASGVKTFAMFSSDRIEVDRSLAEIHKIEHLGEPCDAPVMLDRLRRRGHRLLTLSDALSDGETGSAAHVHVRATGRDVVIRSRSWSNIVRARDIAQLAASVDRENLWIGVIAMSVCGIAGVFLGWIGPIQAALLYLFPFLFIYANSLSILRGQGVQRR